MSPSREPYLDPAVRLGARVRAGELDPRDLVEHYLERIAGLNETVGGYVTVTASIARSQAREVARQLREGSAPPGPLVGVPVAVKDLTFVAGVRCTLGSQVYADFVPHVDDVVVRRLREAGMPLLGKTNTPELGLPAYTEPDVAPPARTPWDLRRSAGGSSGGAAAAVAAGLAPVAQGSDGGGSVRIPASVCGLVGLKTSRGRVSSAPFGVAPGELVAQGPLARTVRDAAALLDVMAGPEPGDTFWVPPLPVGESFLGWCDRTPGRLRIGRYATPVIAAADVHPECHAGYDRATQLLERLGHDVVEVEPPFTPEIAPLFETVWSVLASLAPVPASDEARLRPLTRWLRQRGRAVDAHAFAQAVTTLRTRSAQAVARTAGYDAVLTPSLAQPPTLVGELRDDDDPEADFAAQKRFTPFTSPYNMTGQPALSLPLHWTAEGLPVGVQLVGRPAGEAALLALAAQLEAARPRPPGPPVLVT